MSQLGSHFVHEEFGGVEHLHIGIDPPELFDALGEVPGTEQAIERPQEHADGERVEERRKAAEPHACSERWAFTQATDLPP